MQTIDGQQLVKDLLAKSRREGRDLWEVMETDGWMLTRTRRRQIAVGTLDAMLCILDREEAQNLLRRYLEGRPATAQDMFGAMLSWLKDYRDAVEAGHVE